jgi:hypothetical protein
MTTTTTEAESAEAIDSERDALMPPEVREEAKELIWSLSAAAGDPEEVYARLQDFCRRQGKIEAAFTGTAAALLLIFSECITESVAPGEYAPLTYPGTDGGSDA